MITVPRTSSAPEDVLTRGAARCETMWTCPTHGDHRCPAAAEFRLSLLCGKPGCGCASAVIVLCEPCTAWHSQQYPPGRTVARPL